MSARWQRTRNRLFVVLLNNQAEALTIRPRVSLLPACPKTKARPGRRFADTPEGKSSVMVPGPASAPVSLPGFGSADL